ncbi:lipoprotein [Kitasatospora sp. MMS16-BH015]|uniref:expansin EXLX1 family cellulose-binding protein n=1 Tax=Kitasatospora sp. MMS16-BH015 TaxID=2018025 RepID=UPI000CA2BA83|nr:expansin EXLX1 family cellulose-binding protein [Kitasatospora sp. MMS16-BH015]AUG81862.1 lipoprotein [Kitasatospora sp. MMS16-BH015]
MRTTRHTAPHARRGRGPRTGLSLALAAVSLLLCLTAMLLSESRDASGHPVAAAAATAPTAVAAGLPVAAAPSTAPPPATTPPPASATASPSSSPTPSADTPSAPSQPPSAATSTSPSPSPGDTTRTATALAGRIKPGTSYPGVATSYDAADGNGACSFGPTEDLMVAAMNHTDYETSQACGATVLVRAADGASITVRIVNECPLPCAPGQLDLSHQAFAKLAALSVGRLPITWSLQSPGAAGTMSIRYKPGSTQWWCGIQVLGHRNPVARLEVRAGGGWRRLDRTDYNYFLSPDGSGCGGPIRVTDIYGEQLTVDGIAVRPDVVQATRVQFAQH